MAQVVEYTTKDGDVIDQICWQHYGRTAGLVEQVLEANPHLAEYPIILDAGVVIKLPVLEPVQQQVLTKWWE